MHRPRPALPNVRCLPGYEIHHIVEEASALKDGFPNSIVNGPQNLVRLPKYKHHAITGWFARINEEYGEFSQGIISAENHGTKGFLLVSNE